MKRVHIALAKALGSGVIAVLLLWEILTVTLADSAHLRGNDTLALELRSNSAPAAATAASRALQEGRPSEAEFLARRSLSASPLDQEPLATLAVARALHGQRASAESLMDLAAAGGWRNPGVQVWMLQAALAHRNPQVALLYADALLRQGLLSDEITGLLRRLAQDPAARATLVNRLAEDPDWRRPIFTDLHTLALDQYDAHEQLLVALRGAGASLKAEETNAFLSLLVEKGEPERAWRAWQRITGQAGSLATLQDPAIRHPVEPSQAPGPFSWLIPATDGLSVKILAGPTPGVRLSFGGAGSAKALEQTLVLPAGRYRIDMHWNSDQNDGSSSLSWRLTCVGGGELNAEGKSQAKTNSGDIISDGIVKVPGQHCRAQKISILFDAKTALSSDISLTGVSLRRDQ